MAFKKGNIPINPIKKGETRNPKGRPPKLITQLKNLPEGYTKTEIIDCLKLISKLNIEQLMDVYTNLEATALERTFARALMNGLVEGDIHTVSYLIERLHGKPQQDINIETTQIVHQVITLPDGNKLLL